jgi:filamentous hemagglutinin
LIGPGGSLGFEVRTGTLAIEGKGLVKSGSGGVPQVDLFARAIEINAALWAGKLTMATGANDIDYASGGITVRSAPGEKPRFALDAGAVGSMYAHSIYLIGTEAGVGVNFGNTLEASNGDIEVTAAGDVRIHPQARVKSVGSLRVKTDQKLVIEGTMDTPGEITLTAKQDTEIKGEIHAERAVRMQAGGKIEMWAASGVQAGGDLVVIAGTDLRTAAKMMSGGHLALRAGGNLSIGAAATIQTSNALSGYALGALENKGLLIANNNLDLNAKTTLVNTGMVLAGGQLNAKAGTSLTNSGHMAAGVDKEGKLTQSAALRLQAPSVVVSGQALAGGELALAADHMNLSGATLATLDLLKINVKGEVATRQAKIYAGKVDISASKLDNRAGGIASKNNLRVQLSGDLENAGGVLLSSHGSTHLQAKVLHNQGGSLLAGEALTVIADTFRGDGLLYAGSNLSLTINQDLVQGGKLDAGQDMSLAVAGLLVNKGKIRAGRDLTVKATHLRNELSGQLLAGAQNMITVSQSLTNTGLIDGALTRLEASYITNHGRIYGNRVAIKSGTLVNEAGPAGPGVIASRGDLDIGAINIINRDHATIVALSDLRIGGNLEARNYVVGAANSLINSAALIEVGRHASFSAMSFNNQNPRFTSALVDVSIPSQIYFRPEGSSTLYNASTTWLCDLVTPGCSKDPAWLDEYHERRLLLPSAQYPDSQYGPPFPGNHVGTPGVDTPILPAYYRLFFSPQIHLTYTSDDPIWRKFGVTPPQGTAPRVVLPGEYPAYVQPYLELNRRIEAFNADFENRLLTDFVVYHATDRMKESRVVTSDPAKVLIAGNAMFSGTVINDKSQIATGGALTVRGPAIQNIGATGERHFVGAGALYATYKRRGVRRYGSAQPYTNPVEVTQIPLAVATAAGGQAVAIGQSSGVTAATLSSNTAAHSGIPAVEIKQLQQRFIESKLANTPYLVVADPQFMGNTPVVSEKNLRQMLQQMDALPLSMPSR